MATLAGARAEGRPVDDAEVRTVAARLRAFDPDDPVRRNISATTRGSSSPTAGSPTTWSPRTSPRGRRTPRRSARRPPTSCSRSTAGPRDGPAGRPAKLADKTGASAYILELATQLKHYEWLRLRAAEVDVTRRVRADSERVGQELSAIVDDWLTDRSG